MTEAAQDAIRDEREVALAALLAGFLAGQYADPVHVSTQGHGGKCAGAGTYADVFAGLLGKSIDELLEVTGSVVATAVSLRRQVVEQPPLGDAGIAALCDAIDPERLVAAAREKFDATDYFGGANKALVLRAIEEAINADEARKIGGKPKPEIVAFAIANVAQTGWLPPELRTKGYVGGGDAS